MKYSINSLQLTKTYGKKNALDGLTFSAEGDRIIGLIGRNGAGKTTFLKTCAGYILPTAGSVEIGGKRPFNNLEVLSDMVFIDEEIQHKTNIKLADILKLGSIYYKNWDGAFAGKLLEYFNLNEKQKYKKLSRGMKTQFNIILGICSRAPVTLMDEPTLGLDAAVRKEFYKILLEDYMNYPRTIVVSSHLLSEIENLLNEIVLINDGNLVMHEPMETMQEYAVYLNGRKDAVMKFMEGKQVLNVEQLGNSVIAAIKNNLTGSDMVFLNENGIDVSKVGVQDLCIYLTKTGREGGLNAF